MPIRVKCKCGKQFGAPEKLAGKAVKCPSCAEPIRIPAPNAPSSPSASSQPAAGSYDELFDELGIGMQQSSGNKCPECKTAMDPEAIVCIECGYNENLGRKMVVKRPVTHEDRVRGSEKPDPVAEKAKNKKKGWFGRG